MNASADRLIEVFNEAKSLASGDAREAYLAASSGSDETLQEQVRLLLAADESAGDFLKPTPMDRSDSGIGEQPGSRIGRYKLLEQIGEGGCGVVYLAEQEEPVQRRVAFKVIKLGMDTRQVVARFEAERQALAVMDHPGIAKVFDAGATETGRPYFVMELVTGSRITDYCDEQQLSGRARLELFTGVCRAIHHAHQKGVIHRDIKPSNVLVAESGGAGEPKVIDFGIAKAIEGKLSGETMHTELHQFIGTPAYMSPEQAELKTQDIDTRSDIYSLGVLLYELLTGNTPFDTRELTESGVEEMRRIIRETEPPRPSTRLSTLTQLELSAVASRRHTDSPKLIHQVRGDLDWIVMKCLEKDRSRRYETANDVALDVERHLKHEPVLACPPSRAYRFRKFARRNKAALAAALALGVAAVGSVIVLAVSNQRVRHERDGKEAARISAVQEKERADANLSRARAAVKEYLLKTSENELLQSGDFQALRTDLLETAIPFYEEFVKQDQADPDLELERGRAYDDLGFLRDGLGKLDKAAESFEQAQKIFARLADRFPGRLDFRLRLAESLNGRGAILKDLSQFDEAEREFREALALMAPPAGGEDASSGFNESLARIQGNLGLLLKESGRPAEAEPLLIQTIVLRESLLEAQPASLAIRGQLATSWNNLGTVLTSLRKHTDAERAFEKSLAVLDPEALKQTAATSPMHSRFEHLRAQAWNNLGTMRREASRFAEAEQAFRESLAIKERLAEKYPSIPQHRQEVASSYNNLGALLSSIDRMDEAQTAYEKAIALYERLAADTAADTQYIISLAGTYSNLGRLIGDQGQLEPSLPWITKGITILENALQHDDRAAKVRESLCIASWARAMTLCGLERYSEAVPDWDRAIRMDDGHYQAKLLLRRASNLLNLKDHARAAADATTLADSAKATADDIGTAAGICALCASIVSGDEALVDAYGLQSVALFRRAVSAGFKDVAHLKTAGDLESVRSREDFQQLIKELEAATAGEEPRQQ